MHGWKNMYSLPPRYTKCTSSFGRTEWRLALRLVLSASKYQLPAHLTNKNDDKDVNKLCRVRELSIKSTIAHSKILNWRYDECKASALIAETSKWQHQNGNIFKTFASFNKRVVTPGKARSRAAVKDACFPWLRADQEHCTFSLTCSSWCSCLFIVSVCCDGEQTRRKQNWAEKQARRMIQGLKPALRGQKLTAPASWEGTLVH